MIDKATIDKIFDSANIVDIVSDFVTLKKKGVNYQACCPFHNEKTPSFVVSPAKGVYKCFGCGKGGNSISFIMEHEGFSYVDAWKYVARKYGIEVIDKELTSEQKEQDSVREGMMAVNGFADEYFKKQLYHTDEGVNIALSYFRERGFSDVIIEKFSLGYSPSLGDKFSLDALSAGFREDYLINTGLTIKKDNGGYYDRFAGRVMFPVHSLSGRVIAFGGRTMRTDKKTAKYLNSPESEIYHKSNTLYGIYFARKAMVEKKRCILVEGYTDVLSMFQSGIENVVASSGTSLTIEQIRLILRFTHNVTVIYDGDSAGIKASIRGIDMLLSEGINVRVVLLPQGEDPDSFAKSRTALDLEEYINDNEVDFLTFKTNLLLKDVKNDPIGRSEVITDVVTSISVIADNVVRNQYVKECSRLLDVDYDLILSEVNKKHALRTSGVTAREVVVNKIKKDRFLSNTASSAVAPDFDELEKEIITYLLRYGDKNFFFYSKNEQGESIVEELNVADTIIDELSVDNIVFRNKLYGDIFQEYKNIVEQESAWQETSINRFINHHNPSICSFVVDLITKEQSYMPSKIWSRFDDSIITEKENLDNAIPKVIAVYKLKFIGDITRQYFKELEDASQEKSFEILKKIRSLDESRKILCSKYLRIL